MTHLTQLEHSYIPSNSETTDCILPKRVMVIYMGYAYTYTQTEYERSLQGWSTVRPLELR